MELNSNLEKSQLILAKKQKECEDIGKKYNSLYKLELENKKQIKKLEEENINLREYILNYNHDNDKEENKCENKDYNNNICNKNLMKENAKLNEENEKLQKYIVSSEFRYSLAIKDIFENKKLKQEIIQYKEQLSKVKK